VQQQQQQSETLNSCHSNTGTRQTETVIDARSQVHKNIVTDVWECQSVYDRATYATAFTPQDNARRRTTTRVDLRAVSVRLCVPVLKPHSFVCWGFVVDLLYNSLCTRFTANRTDGVWA